jgi:hypothetical protein
MKHLTGDTHPGHRHAPLAWAAQTRIAVVVAVCLVIEAIAAKNVMDVSVNIVAFLAPLWVFAVSLAWPTEDRAYEIGTIVLAIGATAGVLVFYSL